MINEKESNINVIKYIVEDFESIDEFSEHMLKINPLVGAIPLGRKDNEFLIPISKYERLEDYLKENVKTLEEALCIFNQHDALHKILDNYMIPCEEVVLNFEYAYMDGDILMLPIIPTDCSKLLSRSKREFMLSVLLAPDYKDNEERLKVFDFIQGRPGEAQAETFEGHEQKPKQQKAEKQKTVKQKAEKQKTVKQKAVKKNSFFKLKEKLFSQNEDDVFAFDKDEFLPSGAYAIRVRSTGALYPLMFGPDFIGTDSSKCSICFPSNTNMEAEHCCITLAKGKYFLSDLNSRSGTLLNGMKVDPGKTYELRSADLICVAGEELVFSQR